MTYQFARINLAKTTYQPTVSWEYLRELALGQQTFWDQYLGRMKVAGARREPLEQGVQVVNIVPLKPH